MRTTASAERPRRTSRPRVSLFARLTELFPFKADFKAVHPSRSPHADSILLLPASYNVRRRIAEALDLDIEVKMPSARPTSRWHPAVGTEQKPVYYTNCPYRLAPSGKVIEVMPPNWQEILRQGQARDFLPITEPLQFEENSRGWSAIHARTGQLILPSRIVGFELEVPENGLFQPGEVYLRPLMHRTFILAVPPTIVQAEAALLDEYVGEEEGDDWTKVVGIPMWDRLVDPWDIYGDIMLDSLASVDESAAEFNALAAFDRVVNNILTSGDKFFILAKTLLRQNAEGANPEVGPELQPFALQLEREFFTAVTLHSQWIERWQSEVIGPMIRKAQAAGYVFEPGELAKLIPTPIHGRGKRPLPKALATMTIEELSELYWTTLKKRAARAGVAPASEAPTRPTKRVRHKAAEKVETAKRAATGTGDADATKSARYRRAAAKPSAVRGKSHRGRTSRGDDHISPEGGIVMQAGDTDVPTVTAEAIRRAGLAPETGERPELNGKPREEFFAKCGHCGERDIKVPGRDCIGAEGMAPNHFCAKCRKDNPALKRQQRQAAAERKERLTAKATTAAPTAEEEE